MISTRFRPPRPPWVQRQKKTENSKKDGKKAQTLTETKRKAPTSALGEFAEQGEEGLVFFPPLVRYQALPLQGDNTFTHLYHITRVLVLVLQPRLSGTRRLLKPFQHFPSARISTCSPRQPGILGLVPAAREYLLSRIRYFEIFMKNKYLGSWNS